MRNKPMFQKCSTMLLAILLLLAGCTQTTPTPAPQSAKAAGAPSKPLVVDDIQVSQGGNYKGIIRPQSPGDPIIVSIKTSGASTGADLEAKLFELKNGQQAGLETRRLKADAEAITELTFKREQPWNSGRYLVEVKLDGKLAGQREVDVIEPVAEAQAAKP